MAIFNPHVLILQKKGVRKINACGDGTGYSLTIKKHYATVTMKKKDKAKPKGKKTFVYSFNLLDLDSRRYAAYGTSFKSEKQAFDRAMKMLEYIDVEMKSVRLDRYYSFPSYVDKFERC